MFKITYPLYDLVWLHTAHSPYPQSKALIHWRRTPRSDCFIAFVLAENPRTGILCDFVMLHWLFLILLNAGFETLSAAEINIQLRFIEDTKIHFYSLILMCFRVSCGSIGVPMTFPVFSNLSHYPPEEIWLSDYFIIFTNSMKALCFNMHPQNAIKPRTIPVCYQ